MFRRHIWPAAAAGIMLLVAAGCSDSQDPIQQYGQEVIQASERTKRVRGQADMQALKTALQQYSIKRGHFPESLDELSIVQYQRIDRDPYSYDPATGRIHLR